MAAQLTTFDAIVLGILGLSTLIAFFRGFIRELLSLGAWVGAGLITLYLFPHSTDLIKHHMKSGHSDHLAAGVGALGTFIAALLAISILNSVIFRYVKTGAEVGLLDNFLGLMFGVLRGAFILSLAFLLMTAAVIPKDNPPVWLKGSITRPYLQQGADMLVRAAPHYLNEMEGMIRKDEEAGEKEKEGTAGENQKNTDRMIDSTQPPQERPPQYGK